MTLNGSDRKSRNEAGNLNSNITYSGGGVFIGGGRSFPCASFLVFIIHYFFDSLWRAKPWEPKKKIHIAVVTVIINVLVANLK